MQYLDVLRELTSMGPGPAAASETERFRPNELRFVLEYAQRPDLDAERRRIEQYIHLANTAAPHVNAGGGWEGTAAVHGVSRALS